MIAGPVLGMRYINDDDQVTRQQIKPGTVRRIIPYARRYRGAMIVLVFITALDAALAVVNPVILGLIIDKGVIPRRIGVVMELSVILVGPAMAQWH